MPRLIGQQVMLREYRSEDFEPMRQWVNDENVTRYLATRFWAPQTTVDTQEFLSRMMQSSHNGYNFVIANAADGSYIGQLDLFRVDWRLRLGEIGMVIARDEDRGRGLGTEALGLLTRFAFQTLGLERIELEVHMENKPAIRCYEKAGFVLEGIKRHAYFNNGTFSDLGMMSILRQDWQALQLP